MNVKISHSKHTDNHTCELVCVKTDTVECTVSQITKTKKGHIGHPGDTTVDMHVLLCHPYLITGHTTGTPTSIYTQVHSQVHTQVQTHIMVDMYGLPCHPYNITKYTHRYIQTGTHTSTYTHNGRYAWPTMSSLPYHQIYTQAHTQVHTHIMADMHGLPCHPYLITKYTHRYTQTGTHTSTYTHNGRYARSTMSSLPHHQIYTQVHTHRHTHKYIHT